MTEIENMLLAALERLSKEYADHDQKLGVRLIELEQKLRGFGIQFDGLSEQVSILGRQIKDLEGLFWKEP